jgi:quercetin dioxygenase-like cupin family protein
MGMQKVFADKNHQILKVEFPTGSVMPEHHATSDAFIILVKGKATVVFKDSKQDLSSGDSFLIPERKQHRLEIKEDFMAYVILGPDGAIEGLPEGLPH